VGHLYIGVCIRVWALSFSRRWLYRLSNVVLNVTPYSLVGTTFRMNLSVCLEYPEDVSVMLFWNSRKFIPDYTTSYPRRQCITIMLLRRFPCCSSSLVEMHKSNVMGNSCRCGRVACFVCKTAWGKVTDPAARQWNVCTGYCLASRKTRTNMTRKIKASIRIIPSACCGPG
jgi:hypothetical protein